MTLANDCLRQLRDHRDQANFPPRLLLLLATTSFQPFEDLLGGIRSVFDGAGPHVPLIGCSVGGVLADEKVLLKGAALVCFASQFMNAEVGVAADVIDKASRNRSIRDLCDQLELTKEEQNPTGTQFLLCFLPGFLEVSGRVRYEAAEIHAAIREATGSRIPMVGGVAGDDFQRKECWQFADDKVYSSDAVVAKIETDLRFGIGLAHGLERTGKHIFVGRVAADKQHILGFARDNGNGFQDLSPTELFEEHRKRKQPVVLGGVSPEHEGEPVVMYPKLLNDGSMLMSRPVVEHWPIELLKCNPAKLRRTLIEMTQGAKAKSRIDPFQLTAVIHFPCAARFENADDLELDVLGALADMRKEYGDVKTIGGLVFGEIGVGPLGRSLMRNVCVSGLVVGDQLHPESLSRRGYKALAVAGKKMAEADTVQNVLGIAIDAIKDAGFPGGMISLVFKDGRSHMMVAQEAHGEGWKAIIPMTQRRGRDKDILNIVATSRQARFVPDARTDPYNDEKAVAACGCISYYVSPLIDPKGSDDYAEVVGLLQIDLGDMSNLKENELPEQLEAILLAFSGQIATALCRAIRTEEMQLSDLFDHALAVSLTKSTVEEAAQEFVDVVVKENVLGTDMLHIRYASDDRKRLRIVGGSGDYWRVAVQHRPDIPANEGSPSAFAFRSREPQWVNDISDDELSKDFIDKIEQVQVREAMQREQSYANLLIQSSPDGLPIGIINIAAEEKWFFSQSLWRSMKTLGQRLFFALQHAKNVELQNRNAAEVNLLLDVTPVLGDSNLLDALRDHAKRIAKAARADVVSVFLRDPARKSLVLRGQHGWKVPMIGKATYDCSRMPPEGMTGTIACERQSVYIPNLADWKSKRKQGSAKYETEMFGSDSKGAVTYEVIALPLVFGGHLLGILTMHNALYSAKQVSRFATTDETRLLPKVARQMSAFVFAARAHEDTKHREEQERRTNEVLARFLQYPLGLPELSHNVCLQLRGLYDFEACAIYVPDDDGRRLRAVGTAGFRDARGNEVELDDMPMTTSVLGNLLKDHEYVIATRSDVAPTLDEPLQEAGRYLPCGEIVSFLALPTQDHDGKRNGVLTLWNVRNHENEEYSWFTDRDVKEMERVARYVARAINGQRITQERLNAARELKGHKERTVYAGFIAGNLTHDLRNLVNNLLGDVMTLSDNAKQREYQEDWTSSADQNKLARLEAACNAVLPRLDNYLDGIARGKLPQFEKLELQKVLQLVARRAEQSRRDGKQVELVGMASVTIMGAKAELEEAIYNIADNGLNATKPGSKLKICLTVNDRKAIVTVIDNGAGIPQDLLREIIRGTHFSKPRDRPAAGVYLAKFFIEQHDGQFEIDSKVDEGTTVTITLPIAGTSQRETEVRDWTI